MKNLLASLFLLISTPAVAGVPCTLPFNLVNGTIADATQVMANYNALVTCLGSAAAAGANSDITQLSGLTTPLAPSQGGTTAFVAVATSTGSANAQIVSSTTPPMTSLNVGNTVVFNAGFTNGVTPPLPAGMTLNVNGTGIRNVLRRTTDGLKPMVGGEIIVGSIVVAVYDGTQYQLMSNVSPHPIGTVIEAIGASSDNGFLLLQGQCISTITYADLWTKMGSPVPGACAANQFALPDGRGRVVAMIDSGGSGRITAAGGNFDGTVLFGSGGLQNKTLLSSDLPNTAPTWSFTSGTATWAQSGNATYNKPNTAISNGSTAGSGSSSPYQFNVDGSFNVAGIAGTVSVTGVTGTNTSINGGVTQTLFSQLQPTLMLNRQIKF